ncbi:hypothetical protein ILYODFUR_008388 [Ilyodon furcidens]|uniref:Uncharacterized protein n=1 Tax=Ilyodon furcidens TaxID=33524 RepID=A0ABV0VEL3_9TELE
MKDAGHDYIGVISPQSISAIRRGKQNKEEGANYDPRMISAKKTLEESRYPVHYLVWHNKHRQLEKELATSEQALHLPTSIQTTGEWVKECRCRCQPTKHNTYEQ